MVAMLRMRRSDFVFDLESSTVILILLCLAKWGAQTGWKRVTGFGTARRLTFTMCFPRKIGWSYRKLENTATGCGDIRRGLVDSYANARENLPGKEAIWALQYKPR
jgi:hypothetical protein